jgi:hypothetical protein
MLAVFLFVMNYSKDYRVISDEFTFFGCFYLSTAAILSLSLQLWAEEVKRWYVKYPVECVVHVIWLLSAIYLSWQVKFDLVITLATASALTLVFLSIFLLSFFREKDDVPLWNFAQRIIIALAIALLVSLILMSGLDLLMLSFEKLFGLHISDKMYTDIAITCMPFLAPILFLQLIPRGASKHDHDKMQVSRFGKGVIHCLFMPLLAAYLITLYVYAAKILISWTLPVGWVSYLVTASMIGMIIVITLIYPLQFTQGNKFDKAVLHWLPLVVIPLLLLMTIGVVRRFNDYGITYSRLYLIVFNVWCYLVCIGLLLTRTKRIWWIPASFGVILFFISVGPQSIVNGTRIYLEKEVKQTMTEGGIKKFPINESQYKAWIAKTDKITAHKIDSKLEYIKNTLDSKSVKNIVDSTVIVGDIKDPRDKSEDENASVTYSCNDLAENAMTIPAGYHKSFYLNSQAKVKATNLEKEMIPLSFDYKVNGKEMTKTLLFPASRLIAANDDATAQLVFKYDNAVFYIDNYNMYINEDNEIELSIWGILFLK